MQEDLAARSPKGKLITATKSSHYIQKLQRGLVIESIRAVLSLSGSLNNVPRHYCYDLNQGTLIALSMDKVPLPFKTNITAIATSAKMELHMPKS
jgi:hypothetical protein